MFVYNFDQDIRDFYNLLGELYKRFLYTVFTFFYLYLEKLAISEQLAQHYIQNIDCVKNNLRYLTSDTELDFSNKK